MDNKFSRFPFPKIASPYMVDDLESWGVRLAARFEELRPIIAKLGLWNTPNIRRYVGAATTQPIYEDARKNPARLELIQQLSDADGIDLWEPLRGSNSAAKIPGVKGFVFAPILDGIGEYQRAKLLAAVSVQECKITIDQDILRDVCVTQPTARHLELWNIANEFVSAVREMHPQRKDLLEMFYYDHDGNIAVSPKYILFGAKHVF